MAQVAAPIAEVTGELHGQADASIAGITPESFVQEIRATINVNYKRKSARAN